MKVALFSLTLTVKNDRLKAINSYFLLPKNYEGSHALRESLFSFIQYRRRKSNKNPS